MKLYDELSAWWPIFSKPEDYRDEAAFFDRLLKASGVTPPRTVLELGSGGGNSASHLKKKYRMTLVDLSPRMLDVSRAINPECEHVLGDMRTVRLGKTFDAVFVHDAICHMTSEKDLKAALRTAAIHCRAGGVGVFVPDFVKETFAEYTDHGGSDTPRGSVRYVQWITDPKPGDSTYLADFGILLRDEKGAVRAVHERHVYGLFARARWRALLKAAGFTPRTVRDGYMRDVFVGRRAGPRTVSRPART